MVSLLDVNLLLALFSESHIHHEAAFRWFLAHRRPGWATCCLTELAFVRISMQVFGDKKALTFADAQRVLRLNLAAEDHQFWRLDYSPGDILPEIQERIKGHQQLTDALLLDLAIRREGKLATFDQRIASLLPAGSPHHRSIEVIRSGEIPDSASHRDRESR